MTESIGKTLKKIRTSKNLSIEEVSEKTRIPKKIIIAIEEDRLHDISSVFYARGFVKSYAQFLGVLEEKSIKRYLSGGQKKDTPILVLEGEKVPGDWFIKYKKHITYVVLAIFSIWVLIFGFMQMKRFVIHVSETHKARIDKKKAMREAKPQTPQVDRDVRSLASDKVKKIEGLQLEIVARYNTWIQVISDGRLLFRGILKKGTLDIWQAKEEIELELGNAGGVSLRLNEKDLGFPGKKGQKKSLVITKDGIKL